MDNRANLGFVFSSPRLPILSQQARSNRGWAMMDPIPQTNTGGQVSKLNQALNYAAENPQLVGRVVDTVTNVAQNVSNRGPKLPGFAGTSNNGHSSGYALSKAPNPKAINLDSGIIPKTFSSEYSEAVENECSPLHMTSSVFSFPTSATAKLFTYFNQEIVFMLQNKVQSNVSFNLPISSDFTAPQILSAFNALVYALQHYYYYKSIISYESLSSNKNQGMWYLRNQITANTIESLSRLEKRLMETPCPPRLNELLRYLMGNFFSSSSQGSPMIKFNPGLANNTMTNVADIDTAIANLALDANNKVFTLMRRAVPDWKLGTLFDVDYIPVYDPNFVTIFANASYSYFNGTNVKVPTVATADTPIAYNTFTNTLDGIAFALTSPYVTADTNYSPGLFCPPAGSNGGTFGLTRRSYYIVAGVKSMYAPELQNYLKRCRLETYNTKEDNITVVANHLFGADKCSGVTANTINESCMDAIDYLMSWDTIIRVKQPSFYGTTPNRGSNKSSRAFKNRNNCEG